MMKPLKLPEAYTYIAAFLTMRCNLKCTYCLNTLDKNFHRNRSLEELSGEQWVAALNRIESPPEIPVTLSGGEPSLHNDFIYIINHIKPELNVDILTNLQWGAKGIERFIKEVDPKRVRRQEPYTSIRVSYHPKQMNPLELAQNVKRMQDAGFKIGIGAVLYPDPENLSLISEAQYIFRKHGVDFWIKEFTGQYKDTTYGNYSKYPGATTGLKNKNVQCRITELHISHTGDVYRCHRDLYVRENPIGSILDENFQMEDKFRPCDKFGLCHPCDVKVKTDYKLEPNHTSVTIEELE